MPDHVWTATEPSGVDVCAVCGGVWGAEYYQASSGVVYPVCHYAENGDMPGPCTGHVAQCHHAIGATCDNDDEACTVDHNCNCLLCHTCSLPREGNE